MQILSGAVSLTTNNPGPEEQAADLSDGTLAVIAGLLKRYAEEETAIFDDIEIIFFQAVPTLSANGATTGIIIYLGVQNRAQNFKDGSFTPVPTGKSVFHGPPPKYVTPLGEAVH